MINEYSLLKMLHIFGVVLFLGNIIVTGFWKAFADFTKDWKIITFSQRLVTYTDFVFTLVGVLIIATTGIIMAHAYNDFLKVRWIAWGFWLFIISGLIWIFILIPIQYKLHRLAITYRQSEFVPQQYYDLEKYWMKFGIIATLIPLMNLYWMVFKPT